MAYFALGKKKILIISLIFILSAVFCNVAYANTFTDSFSSIYSFINKNIIAQVKRDFCRQYILSITNGDWKEGEFRTNLGKNVCATAYIPTESQSKISKASIQALNDNTRISRVETPSTSSVNNPPPDVYVPNMTGGVNLHPSQIISITNNERKSIDSNLVNLNNSGVLTSIASIRVKDMFAKQYFEHNSPSGDNTSKEAVENNYQYITIGENIALGNFDGSGGLVTAWMNSPGHRANILNKNYTEIGVYAMQGVYQGQSVWIAAQIFGKPITGCISPDTTLKDKISKYKVSADSMMNSINNIDVELKTLSATDTQTYNSKVAERNTLAGLYNNLASEIKTSVAEYNKEVSAYNLCIKTL